MYSAIPFHTFIFGSESGEGLTVITYEYVQREIRYALKGSQLCFILFRFYLSLSYAQVGHSLLFPDLFFIRLLLILHTEYFSPFSLQAV